MAHYFEVNVVANSTVPIHVDWHMGRGRDHGYLRLKEHDARSLYEQLGAVLGALDAETHPKNPEKA